MQDHKLTMHLVPEGNPAVSYTIKSTVINIVLPQEHKLTMQVMPEGWVVQGGWPLARPLPHPQTRSRSPTQGPQDKDARPPLRPGKECSKRTKVWAVSDPSGRQPPLWPHPDWSNFIQNCIFIILSKICYILSRSTGTGTWGTKHSYKQYSGCSEKNALQ